jgi:conjugal transfer mating pair stabilization protein TraN
MSKKALFISGYSFSFITFAFLIVSTPMLFIVEQAYAVICTNPKEVCVEPGATRTFEGVSVTLPCWRYETTWECHEDSDNNCQVLREQGCSQTSARCLKMFGGTCAVQEETYDCPTKQSGTAKGVRIGDEFFCISGDCASVNPKSNKNFSKMSAYAAVLNEAAEDIKKQNTDDPRIFTGKVIECSRNIANAKNCCANCGWAKGLLGGCADDEVELAKARELGLAVEAGNGNHEYCHNKVLGVCTSYHQVYCVFPSKIARIVQVEGRRNQLGIGFGVVGDDYAHPDCRGITPEELSRLDFGKMDFRSLYNDMLRKAESILPNPQTIGQRISENITKQKKQHEEGN